MQDCDVVIFRYVSRSRRFLTIIPRQVNYKPGYRLLIRLHRSSGLLP